MLSAMQFREQGKKVQCIRSIYDPATKRSHQKVVAAFDRWADKLPSSGLEGLSEAEHAALVEWFAARQAKAQAARCQYRLIDAPRTLADLSAAIRAADTLLPDHAAAIWRELGEVGKALRKAGHPRPKRERVAPPAPPGQVPLDLLD